MKINRLLSAALITLATVLTGCVKESVWDRETGIDESKAAPEGFTYDEEMSSKTTLAVYWDGQKAKAAGLTLLYHNHDFEFTKLPSGEFGLDYMYSAIPADLLQTELDQCWVKYSGQDPVAYLQKYTGRAPVVHLKDYFAEGKQEGDPYALIGLNENEKKENTAFEFRPLGHGVQDIPSIIKASKAAGSKWLIVEQDQPSMGKTPLECVATSMEYLKKVRAEGACCEGGHEGHEGCNHNHAHNH